MVLQNLKILRDQMKKKEMAVTVFKFKYKSQSYFVAVCLLTEDDKERSNAQYALVRLRFMQEGNLSRALDCYANSQRITVGLTELRHFLGVASQPDGRAWVETFYCYLSQFIPTTICSPSKEEEQVILHTICAHEKRDPNKTYRYYMFRNGTDMTGRQKRRSEYNGQLASYKFPQIYPQFRTETAVSFAFTEYSHLEKSEDEILTNFYINEKKRISR